MVEDIGKTWFESSSRPSRLAWDDADPPVGGRIARVLPDLVGSSGRDNRVIIECLRACGCLINTAGGRCGVSVAL